VKRELGILLAVAGVAHGAATPEDLAGRAREALAAGRLDEATELARELEARDGSDAEGYRIAGLAAFRGEHYEPARVAFLAQLQRVQDAAAARVVRFNLAGAELKLGRFSEAQADYLIAADDPELAPLATLNAAIAADGAGAHDTSGELLATAAHLGAGSAVGEQARRLLNEWRDARAADRCDAAWALAGDARKALKEGRIDDAAAIFYGALAEAHAGKMKPADKAELEFALAHALVAAGRPKEAIPELRSAVAAVPKDAEFHYLLAVALHDAGDDGAAAEFRVALESGLERDDAARTRGYLEKLGISGDVGAGSGRLRVEPQVSFGYDTNYASGRETLFQRSLSTDTGASEILVDVEPRFRLLGRPSNGLYVGDHFDALIYGSSAADPFSLMENALYLEGAWSPTRWLTLKAYAEGYLQTAGVLNFGLYQTGFLASLKATAYEGDYFATRLRYAHVYMYSLDSSYSYMTGQHDEAGLAELFYAGTWRLSLGYLFRNEAVGVQTLSGAVVLSTNADYDLRCEAARGRRCMASDSPEGLADPTYSIPWSYQSHEVGFDGDGDLGAGFHLGFGIRYEHRDYGGQVTITPAPLPGTFHDHRVDDRLTLELQVKHAIGAGFLLRVSLLFLNNWSTIDNTQATSALDFDDKNYNRFVGTLDLLRPF
jgi:tetratricopeptide (TPR) repeat protein